MKRPGKTAMEQSHSERAVSHVVTSPQRLTSVDALRGFDMFWIMGGGPFVMAVCKLFANPLPHWLDRQFDHVDWEGFVGWDLIMPLFLFIVGVAMPFSIGKRIKLGETRGQIYRKVAYRVVALWILGMVAQGNLLAFDPNNLQLYSNTLQAIAAGYLISSAALVELRVRGQAALAALLLVVFWLLLAFFPVPGHGAGAYTPDGNLALWIDKAVLGRFQDGTTYTWILSSLGFGATVLMGVLAGQLLRSSLPGPRKASWLAASGLACLLAGWLWSFVFPIIKHIWTSSMVLWSGGWCLLLLAAFYWLIDVKCYRRWAFFLIVIGMNAIVAYMAAEVLPFAQISGIFFAGLAKQLGMFGEVLVTLGALGILWLCLYYLYRNRTFIRI
jgi:predicted acyltransferase